MEENEKKYEMTFITLSEKERDVALDLLRKFGADIQDGSHRGARVKLAYPIKKEAFGHWNQIVFAINPGSLEKLNNALNASTAVLRFILTSAIGEERTRKNRFSARQLTRESRLRPGMAEVAMLKEEKPEAVIAEKKEKRGRSQETFRGELSNEALEKKLEEILSE